MSDSQGSSQPVTDVLERWATASDAERNRVIEILYHQLKQRAVAVLSAGQDHRIVDPTVLVSEAYLKLVGVDRMDWEGRKHFLNVATKLMRQIVVDIARRERATKRGRDLRTEFRTVMDKRQRSASSILDIDAALTELGAVDEQYLAIVEARIFA